MDEMNFSNCGYCLYEEVDCVLDGIPMCEDCARRYLMEIAEGFSVRELAAILNIAYEDY